MAYPSANWTIMVYICADDVLANFAVESLKQLRDAAGDGIVVLAQFDANQHRDTPIYLFDGKQPNRATSSIENSRVATIAGPVDMTLPATLQDRALLSGPLGPWNRVVAGSRAPPHGHQRNWERKRTREGQGA